MEKGNKSSRAEQGRNGKAPKLIQNTAAVTFSIVQTVIVPCCICPLDCDTM